MYEIFRPIMVGLRSRIVDAILSRSRTYGMSLFDGRAVVRAKVPGTRVLGCQVCQKSYGRSSNDGFGGEKYGAQGNGVENVFSLSGTRIKIRTVDAVALPRSAMRLMPRIYSNCWGADASRIQFSMWFSSLPSLRDQHPEFCSG